MNENQWPLVKKLFHGALERAPEERAAFLTGACPGNGEAAELRAEVERLLAAHGEARSFIEQSPAFAPTGATARQAESPTGAAARQAESPTGAAARQALSLTGRTIGRYEVGRLVGIGGMGEVYAAKDLELGRAVAIKIGIATDADAHARLKREAQHASRLNHPHICTIHEVGVFDGQPFIVMEFVEGRQLSDVIPAGGLPVADVTRYGMQIADALAHAHRNGVTHRDLKSANVVVTPEGRAKILDFGLARRLSPQHLKDLSQSQESVTAEGLVAGTLSCMAPELLRGEPADARSDIWSLGVVLYEMASRARPFGGVTGFELSGAILHSSPAPLPERIPPSLREIIHRCLQKDPRNRYQQADEIRAALEAIASNENRRTLPWRGIAAAAAVLVIAGATVATLRWHAAEPAPASAAAAAPAGRPAIAVMNFENVAGSGDTAWLSKGVPRMLVTGLAQTSGLHIVSTQRLEDAVRQTGGTSFDALTGAQAADAARRAGAGAIVSGTIAEAGGQIRVDVQVEDLSSGRVLAAESVQGVDVFALTDQLSMRIRNAIGFTGATGVRRVAEVSSSSLEAYRLYSEGVDASSNMRWVDARRLLGQAVAIDPGFSEAYLQLAVVEAFRQSETLRREYLAKAVLHADRLSERRRRFLDLQVARGSGNPAKVAQLLDSLIADYPDTEEAYGAASALYIRITGPVQDSAKLLAITDVGVKSLPSSGPVRNARGYALLAVGRYIDALREFEAYARLAPREPNPHDSTGEAYLQMGVPEKALESYSVAYAIDPAWQGGRDGRVLALAMLGRYDEAIAGNASLAAVRAIVLSRAGRYREAAKTMAGGQSDIEGPTRQIADGMLHLLAAVFALEQHDAARALREVSSAEGVLAPGSYPRKQALLALAHLIGGIADIKIGNAAHARSRLETQARIYNRNVDMEMWWHKALEGELALAAGDAQRSAAAFSSGEPRLRWFSSHPISVAYVANHLPSRDGPARAAKAHGDLAGAIATYRRLLSPGADNKWASVLEPRYVLELARLLEKTGDRAGALREYERFLPLWKGADSNLPELAEARTAIVRLR